MSGGLPSTLALLVRRSLARHAVSTSVTALSIALACGLVLAVVGLGRDARAAFTGGGAGYDAVLGARGSALQLVLNAVFHLETSPGNLPWSVYRQVAEDPRVERAVPYAVGDQLRGFRVVGTTLERFEDLALYEPGRLFDPARREAVLGASVARALDLGRGSHLHPEHGTGNHGEAHEEEFVVTGVLRPTGTPADRVVWIPIEGVFRMGGHVLRGEDEVYVPEPGVPIPEEHKEVSAVLLDLVSPQAGFQLDRELEGERDDVTLAWPIGASVAELFDELGWAQRVLELVAWMVVVVAAAAVLASLYNTMSERRREIAILRALGARRSTVFAAVLLEAAAIGAIGAALGTLVHALLRSGAAAAVQARTGVVLESAGASPAAVLVPLAVVALATLAGALPALRAYRVEVAPNLEEL